jgi:DNA-binding NtrC family response regulator
MISLKGKTILIVDDEKDLRDVMVEEFSYFGATVDSAENGKVALDKILEKKFDVVISDVRMAHGDGLTLLKEINSRFKIKPKLFLCSGFNDVSSDIISSLGVIQQFNKPFNFDKLLESVAKALDLPC